jgi:hypothetical protein
VISPISAYEYPCALSVSARTSWGFSARSASPLGSPARACRPVRRVRGVRRNRVQRVSLVVFPSGLDSRGDPRGAARAGGGRRGLALGHGLHPADGESPSIGGALVSGISRARWYASSASSAQISGGGRFGERPGRGSRSGRSLRACATRERRRLGRPHHGIEHPPARLFLPATPNGFPPTTHRDELKRRTTRPISPVVVSAICEGGDSNRPQFARDGCDVTAVAGWACPDRGSLR